MTKRKTKRSATRKTRGLSGTTAMHVKNMQAETGATERFSQRAIRTLTVFPEKACFTAFRQLNDAHQSFGLALASMPYVTQNQEMETVFTAPAKRLLNEATALFSEKCLREEAAGLSGLGYPAERHREIAKRETELGVKAFFPVIEKDLEDDDCIRALHNTIVLNRAHAMVTTHAEADGRHGIDRNTEDRVYNLTSKVVRKCAVKR